MENSSILRPAAAPFRMLRQFVGTKLALICDPILRCLYLNRSNFQLLVNLVEMDEFWLYCSFYSGNDFSSAVPYQCFMRFHASSTHGYITVRICSQHTESSPSVVFSQIFTIIGCLSLAFPIFTFNLGFKICWNILYNNPVQSNFFFYPQDASCRLLLLPLCLRLLDFHECLKLITEFSLR